MVNGAAQYPKWAVVAATATATPIALGFETTVRLALLPADFWLVRSFLRPTLTPIAWALLALTVTCSLGASLTAAWVRRRALDRCEPATPASAYRARLNAFVLSSSVAQAPAVLATFCFTFGAELTPVLLATLSAAVAAGYIGARAPLDT